MNLPVLALRGLTIFPGCILTFDVEREISIRALERAMESDQQVFLVAQREVGVALPGERDLYQVGTISVIRQILRISEDRRPGDDRGQEQGPNAPAVADGALPPGQCGAHG